MNFIVQSALLLGLILWVGCDTNPSRGKSAPPPFYTDINGRWAALNRTNVPILYSKVLTLTNTAGVLHGTGEFCSDHCVAGLPNPMAFTVTGTMNINPTSREELVTIRTSEVLSGGRGPSTNIYRVIRSKTNDLLILNAISDAGENLINLDVLEKRTMLPGRE